MTRKRGSTMGPNPTVRFNRSQMTLFVLLIVSLGIMETRGDFMMGGHLDNKDEHEMPKMEHRSDEGLSRASFLSSRTANLEDDDFDLELDLLAEQSAAEPTRLDGSSSGDPSSKGETTISDETETAPRYRVLPYAFNGGHPFSLEKDPITGQIDFEKAPPLQALKYNVEPTVQNDEGDTTNDDASGLDSDERNEDSRPPGPNEINPYSPSFHDFLNLPVRYTYDKYKNSEKYPLISSSYANTKVQSGSSSYNTYNHKKYHEAVKAGVDVQTLFVQPSRKTYAQSVTKSTTTARPNTITTRSTTTTTTTTTMGTPQIVKKPTATNIHEIYDDYEGTLPIERLQPSASPEKEASTEKSHLVPAQPPRQRPDRIKPVSEEDKNEEYEEGYDEDYDRILQIANKPEYSHEDENSDSQDDYTYGGMDFSGDSGSTTITQRPNATSTTPSSTTASYTKTSTAKSESKITSSDPTIASTRGKENLTTTPTTTLKPTEEKRVTSMPIDTIENNDYRITGMNYADDRPIIGTIDNSLPSVTSNNVLYHHNRPSNNDNYYHRPTIGMPSGGIVVKSTSNVVIPPGQDTVSFVLGNRQSVGSVSDAGSDFYGIHSRPATSNDRSTISFGKIGNSRPASPADNYSGQMIVSAGIGVGTNPVGSSYHQRPSNNANSNNNNFDGAVVTIGMPTVDVANSGESGTTLNANKNSDTAANSLNVQDWWAATSSGSPSANNQQSANSEVSDEPANQQFGHRVVFPDERGEITGSKIPGSDESSSGTPRPIEERVVVVHESEIGNGNSLQLDLSSESSPRPTTVHHYESTTQRFPGASDEKLLPQLSESLTPPAERPNILPSGVQRPPSYNYYHHQSRPPGGNPRPNDFRDQRLPQRPPSSSSSASGFKRRPAPPTIESNLPNILPQFRPNAKTSHGHNRGETIGTIPAGPLPPYPNNRIRRPPPAHLHHHHHRSPTSRRPSNNLPHLQRLNPPPLPPPPPPITSLRLPTPASLIGSPNLGSSNQHESPNQKSDGNSARPIAQNRLHKLSVGAPPSLAIDERHRQTSNGFGGKQQIKSRLEDETLERFSAEPPARPPYFTKRTAVGEPDGMPRIATLQMIQQHAGGSHEDDIVGPNLPPPYRFNEENSSDRHDNGGERTGANVENDSNADRRGGGGDASGEESGHSEKKDDGTRLDYVDAVDAPVYVVYPVKGALDIRPSSNDDVDHDDASVVLGTYGSQRPLPPETLLQASQNGDESVDAAENNDGAYGPSSIVNVSPSFAESTGHQLASDFPYPLERPDPSMFTSQLREKPLLVPSDHRKNGEPSENEENEEKTITEKINDRDVIRDIDRDTSVNVIPYLQDHLPFNLKENSGVISATLQRLGPSSASIVSASSTPIAYVFTPTARTPVRRNEEAHLSNSNFEGGPILLPSQQPSSSSSSAPSPQSFMAPFVASASAEAPTKNGWSVVMVGQSSGDHSTSMERRRQDTVDDNENEKSTGIDKIDANEKDLDAENEKKNGNQTKSPMMEKTKNTETNVQTEKNEFDVENFTPQLFGGFRPIFEFPSDTDTDSNIGERVNGDTGTIVERPRSETG